MNLLGPIKEKLTDSLIDKVSVFLGESPVNINAALERVFPTIFGVIILDTTVKASADKVMDVLKNGGHTGEILDDLPGLLEDFDKTHLLVTIGTNIFNHFYGNKSNGVFETIASLSDIRKTSASSLVGLAMPLVLGALGKVVAEEGMNLTDLMKYLNEQRESVIVSLPPVLINKLIDREDGALKKPSRAKAHAGYNNRTKTSGLSAWIPWVILVVILAAIVFYLFKYKEKTEPRYQTDIQTIDSSAISIDTSMVNGFEDSTGVLNPADTIEIKPNETLGQRETKPQGESYHNSNSGFILFINQLLNSNSWIVIPDLQFNKGNALIKNEGAVNDLALFLKNNPKSKVTIAAGSLSAGNSLGSDRSSAIRKLLTEKGIVLSRIDIHPKLVTESEAEIFIKVYR